MGLLRSDRVTHFPAPPRPAPAARDGRAAAPARGSSQASDPQTWPAPAATTITGTTRYGTATAAAWDGCTSDWPAAAAGKATTASCPSSGHPHPRQAEHLPGDRSPGRRGDGPPRRRGPCRSGPYLAGVPAPLPDRTQFRFLKQVPGWTRPKPRDPAAADRWTWLIFARYAQLWLARGLAEDLRLPWQPGLAGPVTPARVRRGFRDIRQTPPDLASAPKPGKPGPGRPPGSKNRRPATRHDVGKTVKRDEPKKKTRRQKVKRQAKRPRG